jgi:probable phosphoglycerate mutase
LYTSPLSRARETAEAIAARHQLVPVVQEDLAELHHGELEGLPYTALPERYPEVMSAWQCDPGAVRLPGGESLEDVRVRAWAAFLKIAAEAEGEVCIVSHKMALSTILCEAIGLPLRHAMRLEVGLCSLSTLELRPGRGWRLLQLNLAPPAV